MKTILLTGANGFLGSHIAEELVIQGYKVLALKRSTSDIWRCKEFFEYINWIDCDNLGEAELEIIRFKPNILIHAAWNGVKAIDRDSWIEQEKNISFLVSLLEIVKKTTIEKIIALGSQAEYGNFESAIDEDFPCNPNTAYGANKVCSSIILKSFAESNKINWFWVRIFSVIGEGANKNWLMPTVISKLLKNEAVALTLCEQKYNYLYIGDFLTYFLSVVQCSHNKSGIYNLCNSASIELKELLVQIANLIGVSSKLLQIEATPYREKQNMLIAGEDTKFRRVFTFVENLPTAITSGLMKTIDYYKSKKS